MRDDPERPVPPHPWPSRVVLVSTDQTRQRLMQSDWLILSSTLLPSLHRVHYELSCNLSQSLSAWLKSHKISPSFLKKDLTTIQLFSSVHFIVFSNQAGPTICRKTPNPPKIVTLQKNMKEWNNFKFIFAFSSNKNQTLMFYPF